MIIRVETDEDLAFALRERRIDLGLTQEEVEHRVNLTSGHLGKIEHGGKTWGKQILRMTQTLVWLLEVYDLGLVIMDKQTLAKLTGPEIQARLRPHVEKKTGKLRPSSQRLLMRVRRTPE